MEQEKVYTSKTKGFDTYIVSITLLVTLSLAVVFLMGYFLRKNKHFTIQPNSLSTNILEVKKGNPINNTLDTVLLPEAVAEGEVVLDSKINEFVLPVSFQKYNSLKANLILGKRDDKILVLVSQLGIVSSVQEWKSKTIEEISNEIKKGSLIISRIYFHKDTSEIGSKSDCDDVCKERLSFIKQYFEENQFFLDTIKNNKKSKRVFNIGPVESLIIYVEK